MSGPTTYKALANTPRQDGQRCSRAECSWLHESQQLLSLEAKDLASCFQPQGRRPRWTLAAFVGSGDAF